MEKNTRIFDVMKKAGLDALIACRQDTVAYCAGYDTPQEYGATDNFIGGPFSYAFVDANQRKITLVVSAWGGANAETTFADEIIPFDVFDFFGDVDCHGAQQAALAKAVAALKGAKKVGIEFTALPVQAYTELLKLGCELVDAYPVLVESRKIKQPYEIERLRYICDIETYGMNCLMDMARNFTGGTELEIFNRVIARMSEKHGKLVRETGDFATGPRSNKLSGVSPAINREIQVGDSGICDMSTRINGYCCDCANTVVFGAEPNAEQKQLFQIVRDAFNAAYEKLVPGNTFYQVDTAAKEMFNKYGKEPIVYTGHQLGTNVNEPPRIQCFETDVIQPNMVVCIEPQNYTFDAGVTGVRLEHAVLITENGPETLTPFKWGLE